MNSLQPIRVFQTSALIRCRKWWQNMSGKKWQLQKRLSSISTKIRDRHGSWCRHYFCSETRDLGGGGEEIGQQPGGRGGWVWAMTRQPEAIGSRCDQDAFSVFVSRQKKVSGSIFHRNDSEQKKFRCHAADQNVVGAAIFKPLLLPKLQKRFHNNQQQQQKQINNVQPLAWRSSTLLTVQRRNQSLKPTWTNSISLH